MQLPVEIQRAEILDWWEAEQERISRILPERLPALYYCVDQLVDNMPIKALLRRERYRVEQIEPIVTEWVEKLYRELTHQLDESFRASSEAVEGRGTNNTWSYGEMATAGAAIAVSIAPVAGIPFFASGLTAAGVTILGLTFGGGALLAVPVAALASSTVVLAAGPAARARAITHLKISFKRAIHQTINNRILGDFDDPSIVSLQGKLLNELRGVALMRMELVE